MTTIKPGDRVRVLTGWYAGQIGRVYAIGRRDNYPIHVEFPNKDVNAYYEEQVERVDEEVTK